MSGVAKELAYAHSSHGQPHLRAPGAFNDYDDFRRELYRTTIAGETPAWFDCRACLTKGSPRRHREQGISKFRPPTYKLESAEFLETKITADYAN